MEKVEKKTVKSGRVPGNERLNTLVDGVFAIIMTMQTFQIMVPKITEETKILIKLQEMMPNILTHLISFVVLGIYWIGHHNMMKHIHFHNRLFIWLNILFLMLMASISFPTGLLVHYSNNPTAIRIFAGSLILTGLSLDLLWWYASSSRRLTDENIDPVFISKVHHIFLTAPCIYLFCIVMSFFSVAITKILFLLTALVYILPRPYDRYHEDHFGD